ncbi:predicted protein [Uncinocarpus reesii 1704]|uniref:Protein kinase domain-containing protein n=1 Tax=Uncinocarpus reesii (strain UAMH 1704) TaxID=336963 RepID=C4JN84_UNCRE|nr:uncharacterized protein UREG_04290 [Uncinocarpus reesii 1704]EEP79444.1 predicted protein [Uncinocarpus reesii 1704]
MDANGDYGDFIDPYSDDDFEYFVETPSIYQPSADYLYYPLCLGEVLNSRYRVEHKLGHGGFSTVWMAFDLKKQTDVALKILTEGQGSNEYHMQNEILQNVKDTSRLTLYLDTFVLPGDHRVLVFPLRSPMLSVITLKAKSMATRMSAARQLLQELESLHKAGIVHRDLNPGNCMWNIKSLAHLERDDPSPACDIWSYMCIFSTLWCGITPFHTRPGEQEVSTMVAKLGPLPLPFKGHYIWPEEEEDAWYIHTPNPRNPGWDLEGTITKFSHFSGTEERKHVLSLMHKCFRYLPEERPTATQLLQDPSSNHGYVLLVEEHFLCG